MRTIKRLLLLAKELSIFLLGVVLSLVVAIGFEERRIPLPRSPHSFGCRFAS